MFNIIMTSGERFNEWKDGLVYYSLDHGGWLYVNEVFSFIDEEERGFFFESNLVDFDKYIAEKYGFLSYDWFFKGWDFNAFKEEYVTEKGERVVAFGKIK